MILIVTNKNDYTADYVVLALLELGIPFCRFNTEDFPTQADLALTIDGKGYRGEIVIEGREIDIHEITSIWYRRPVSSTVDPRIHDPVAQEYVEIESEVTLHGLWRVLDCFWVSHPDALRVAESKLYQLQMASQVGFAIPSTIVTNSPQEASTFYEQHGREIICKPQRHSRLRRGDEVGLLYTNAIRPIDAAGLHDVQFAPTLFQPNIRKQLELRITVVGTQLFCIELHSQVVQKAQQDWRRAYPGDIEHRKHRLPKDIGEKCLQLVRKFQLNFAAIDMILTPSNEYIFLELNPNGQWAWIDFACPDISIREALVDLLANHPPRKSDA